VAVSKQDDGYDNADRSYAASKFRLENLKQDKSIRSSSSKQIFLGYERLVVALENARDDYEFAVGFLDSDSLDKEIESRTIDRAAPFSYQNPLAGSYYFGMGI
jgi:hypothetical protein